MNYKECKSKRAYHNKHIHSCAAVIFGADDMKEEVSKEVKKIIEGRKNTLFNSTPEADSYSVSLLTDIEAEELCKKMQGVATQVKKNANKANELIGIKNEATVDQKKKIIRITKYVFKWSVPASFSFILNMFPDKRKRLNSWEIQNSKIDRLYKMLSKDDADKIIKKLEKIEERNEQSKYQI